MLKKITALVALISLVLAAAAMSGCSSSQAADIILPPEAASTPPAEHEDVGLAAAATVNTVANAIVLNQAQPTPVPDNPEPLRRGMEGDTITALQNRLNELGYMDTVTGFFGGTTEQAVTEFQADNGMQADGIVGSQTWLRLFAADA